MKLDTCFSLIKTIRWYVDHIRDKCDVYGGQHSTNIFFCKLSFLILILPVKIILNKIPRNIQKSYICLSVTCRYDCVSGLEWYAVTVREQSDKTTSECYSKNSVHTLFLNFIVHQDVEMGQDKSKCAS